MIYPLSAMLRGYFCVNMNVRRGGYHPPANFVKTKLENIPFGVKILPILTGRIISAPTTKIRVIIADKKPPPGIPAAVLLFRNYSSLKPLGFWLCQRQESRHMSARDFSAFQPSSSADLPGSA